MMQKDSTAEAFAEAYGIPLKHFKSWLPERKEGKNKGKRQHNKEVKQQQRC